MALQGIISYWSNAIVYLICELQQPRTLQIREDETTVNIIQRLMQKFGLPLSDVSKWKLYERTGASTISCR